jgi:hypothetical protein
VAKRKKDQRPPIEIAIETAGTVREAAERAEHVARRLLRRTRLLTGHAARNLPVAPPHAQSADDGLITLVLPPQPAADERAALDQELLDLRARAERAEHAAAWLRARLRVERSRAARTPQVDVAALTADLTRGLTALNAPHPGAVRRVVQRTLAAHGLAAPGVGVGDTATPPWSQEEQEALARAVLARAPEVADPAYVYRAIGLLAQRGRLTLPELTRAAGFDSAMARRRLRLAVEALVALSALSARDGAYSLNPAWKPPTPAATLHGRQGRKGAPRR